MTVPMIKSIGDVPYPIDTHSDAFSPLLTAGAALGITGNDAEESAWLTRTSEADGVASVRSIHGNTIVQDGALVPVNMTGIESTGFNQWDEVWEAGGINHTTGENQSAASVIRSKNYIPVIAGQTYYAKVSGPTAGVIASMHYYDANKTYLSYDQPTVADPTFTVPAGACYMRFNTSTGYGAVYHNDICINISDPTRNGTYEPYWQQTRSIPATDLRSAGSVYDEQTATERIVRVGEVDLGTLVWVYDTSNARFNTSGALPDAAKTSNRIDVTCGKYTFAPTGSPDKSIFMYNGAIYVYDSAYTDAATFKAAMSGVMAHYALATPTTTPIDPPLNLTYRTAAGGTERVMVPTGELSAPPTIVAAQGYTAESLRDAALSAIAPVENGKASTNYSVGSYLVHGGQLCKVTTAIATGEAISIGTNVTATTVMAEVLSLIQ